MYIAKMTAEMQSWLWLTAFVAATLIPFFLFVPDTKVKTVIVDEIVNKINHRQTIRIPSQQSALPASGQNVIETRKQSIGSQTEWHVPSHIIIEITPFLYLFFAIWLFGGGWRAHVVIKSYYRTRQLLNSARKEPKLKSIQCFAKVPVLVSDLSTTPMVAGLINPILLLPKVFLNDLSEKQLKPIIFHELAHIQRKDLWFGFFQELIAIIFWWSPVIRLLNRKIHISRELACDLRAAKRMSSSKHYAQSLLDCARLMLEKKQSVLAMGMFSHKKDLKHRINTVLQTKSNSKSSLILISSACCLLIWVSISTAQNFVPKVSLSSVESQSKQYSALSRQDSEVLISAVNRNDLSAIKRLVNEGVDIDTPIIGDGTVLMLAIKRNNRKLVEALIEMGVNVNQASRGDGTPLIVAVKSNNNEIVNVLINSGADVNQPSRGDGNPLIMAASINNLELTRLLLAHGADINAVVAGDETALINATRNGHLQMTSLLVEQGADVNLSVKTGWSDGFEIRSPLNMARNSAIKNYLKQHGAIE